MMNLLINSADELNGDDDVIKRLRQSNHVSAYGPPPVSVSENQPPGHPPPPHPASDLASYMYGVQPQQPQQQQHSPHQNKWSPAPPPPSGSVKEEPKPNMNQQQAAGPAGAAGADMGQAPESPQQQEVCEN